MSKKDPDSCFSDYVEDKIENMRPNEKNNLPLDSIQFLEIAGERKMIDTSKNEVEFSESLKYVNKSNQ